MRWEWFVAALLALTVVTNVFMTWLLWPDTCPIDAPKYRLQDFRKVPPIIPGNPYGQEKRINTFYCIGSEKDCGRRPTEIPEPGTAVLIGAGLAALVARRAI